MIIRREQMQVLEDSAERGFEERMLARIREFFPKHPVVLDDAQLRLLIALALGKARSYGFSTERNVALYLDLMCVLGCAFDVDPQMPWASDILAGSSTFPDADARADELHNRGWDFAQAVSGDFSELIQKNDLSRMMTAMRDIGRQSLEELPAEPDRDFATQLSAKTKAALPVRCGIIGDERLEMVMGRAFESATNYGVRNARGVYLFTALSLAVGSGFDDDPQLPWASRTLTDPSTANDPAARTKRLHREAVECLKQWWNIGVGVEA